MGSRIIDLLYTYVLASFDKQLRLADLVGGLGWNFDMTLGSLSFGNRFRWRAQMLGTVSESSGRWLWAWANMASKIPEELLQASLTMRTFGIQFEIPELTEPEFPLNEIIDGNTLSLIASGVYRANAFYRGPYKGGAVYLLIQDDFFPCNVEQPLKRIASVFPQTISALDISNHRVAFSSYLASYGLLGISDGEKIVVEDRGKGLIATFDEQNRLIELDARF
jgi:hypothetical protein